MLRSLILTAAAAIAASGDPPSVPAVRLSDPPTVDGSLDDPAWSLAARAEPFVDPFTSQPPRDATTAWIAYDGDAIYVAFRCFDREPSAIVGREVQPGSEFEGEDTVTFSLDTFNTRQGNTSRFTVNALGTQTEEIAGGRSSKREWRGEWNTAVARDETGWSIEMRIPWRILNTPGAGERSMGINFSRHQARTRVESQWSNLTPAERPELIGTWTKVDVPATAGRKKLEFLGYTSPEFTDQSAEMRAGLDVRYGFNEQTTGLVSLNPDFRNIEQEVADISFTRSERFVSDARPFFTEGGDFFRLTEDYTFGRMFFSRRIESFDWGAKVYGRARPDLGVGALATVDAVSTTAAVVNLTKEFGPYSSLSLFGTMLDEHGTQNTSLGTTFFSRAGNFWGSTEMAATRDEDVQDTAGAFAFAYDAPKWLVLVRHIWVEPDFRPALGLISFADRRGPYLYAEHQDEFRTGPVRDLGIETYWEYAERYDGTPFMRAAALDASAELRNDMEFSVGYERGSFEGEIDSIVRLGTGFNVSNRYRKLEIDVHTGTLADKPATFVSLEGSYRAFGKVDLGVASSVFRLQGTERQTVITVGWEIDARRSLTGRFVAENGNENWYVTYRSAGFSGVDLFVILGDPNAETFQRRLGLKLVWAF